MSAWRSGMTTLQGRFLHILLTVPLFFLTMVLAHEAGHAVTAHYATRGEVRIYVWPGYELYPDPANTFPEAWPARTPAMTAVMPRPPQPVSLDTMAKAGLPSGIMISRREFYELRRHEHLMKLMGSTTTLLLALASLAALSLFKPKGTVLWLLAAGSLLHLDMLTYTLLPTLFGVRHLYWIGGEVSETLEALAGLGLKPGFSITAIVLLSLLQWVWLFYLLRVKLRRPVQ
jgi:hypothetical protein